MWHIKKPKAWQTFWLGLGLSTWFGFGMETILEAIFPKPESCHIRDFSSMPWVLWAAMIIWLVVSVAGPLTAFAAYFNDDATKE